MGFSPKVSAAYKPTKLFISDVVESTKSESKSTRLESECKTFSSSLSRVQSSVAEKLAFAV